MLSDLVIDLVRHMKAKNARKWPGPDLERPLSKLGLRQAEMHAQAMANGDAIVALYSSPALRCRQTLEPLASLLGIELRIEPLLAETRLFATLPIGAENPLIELLRSAHPDGGRVVACSHADTIPAFVDSLTEPSSTGSPALIKGFGGWYRARIAGASTSVERIEPPAGFPVE